jgi:hypothetical protein
MAQLLPHGRGFRAAALRKRVSRLSAGFSWRPVLSALLAIGLAWVAHERSSTAGRRHWLLSQLPPEKLVQEVLKARGFSRVQDPHQIDRAWRNLPSTVVSEPEVWWHSSGKAAVFYVPDSENSFYLPLLFLNASTVALDRNWVPLGLGWEGLARLIEKPMSPQSAPPARLRATLRVTDPRQLHY